MYYLANFFVMMPEESQFQQWILIVSVQQACLPDCGRKDWLRRLAATTAEIGHFHTLKLGVLFMAYVINLPTLN
jgi:hypothetical protein